MQYTNNIFSKACLSIRLNSYKLYFIYWTIAICFLSACEHSPLQQLQTTEKEILLPPRIDTFRYELNHKNHLKTYPKLNNDDYGDFMLNMIVYGSFENHKLRDTFRVNSFFYDHFGFNLLIIDTPEKMYLSDIDFPALYKTEINDSYFIIIRYISRQYTTEEKIGQ